MNDTIVVDASVAFKWVLREELSDVAQALLFESPPRRIVGPPHLETEVTNAIYQRLRRQGSGISPDEGQRALQAFLHLGVEFMSFPDLHPRAFHFAQAHSLSSVYDALYVVLAEMLGAELWTDDRRLLRDVRSLAPWVRWIGEYPWPESAG